MANNILVDTSILIGLQRGDPKIISRFEKYLDQVVISRITANEFIYGSKDRREKSVNKKFIESLEIAEVNEDISALSFALIDNYGLKTRLGIADALIAATAIWQNFSLWTENLKHYMLIRELTVFNGAKRK